MPTKDVPTPDLPGHDLPGRDLSTRGLPADGGQVIVPEDRPAAAPRLTDLTLAFLSGGLLTFMILLNGRLSLSGGPLFASWTAHGTGTVAAMLFIWLLRLGSGRGALPDGQRTSRRPRAPLWAYAGGLVGAVTVMLSSVTVNTALALSGTLALGLAGQVGFSLVADRFGLFGLPRRIPDLRDGAALALIVAGSLLIIFAGGV